MRKVVSFCSARSFLLLLMLLAFALRVYHLGYQSLWRDEADALRFATEDLGEFLRTFTHMGQNGPLFFLMLRPWLAAAGQSEFALRFPSVLFGTLAVPVSYGLLRSMAGRKPAAMLALLMAASPYLVWYGQEAKMYALLSMLVPLSLWLAVLAVRRRRWYYWVGLYVVTSLAVYNHLLAPLVVPVQIVWLALLTLAPQALWRLLPSDADSAQVERPAHPQLPSPADNFAQAETLAENATADDSTARAGTSEERPTRTRLAPVAIYLAALGLPYLPILRWAVPLLLANYQTGFEFVPLPKILQNLVGVWSRGLLPFFGATAMPMLLAAVAGSVLWAVAHPRAGWRLVALLLTWMLLPAVEIYIISFGTPIYVDRYLIWAMPAFLALCALGIVMLIHAWRPLGLLALAAILALNVTDVAAQQVRPLKSDFRGAAAYVRTHQRPGDRLLFQIPYNQYLYAYYAGAENSYVDGPYTNNGMSDAEVDSLMGPALAGAAGVWLVASEAETADRRGMTAAWLNAHATITDRWDFTLVSVIRYQMQGP